MCKDSSKSLCTLNGGWLVTGIEKKENEKKRKKKKEKRRKNQTNWLARYCKEY